jgi:recombinational DNA repair protein RecR
VSAAVVHLAARAAVTSVAFVQAIQHAEAAAALLRAGCPDLARVQLDKATSALESAQAMLQRCPECGGTGFDEDARCDVCDGTGLEGGTRD